MLTFSMFCERLVGVLVCQISYCMAYLVISIIFGIWSPFIFLEVFIYESVIALLVSHVLYHICDLNAHWNVYSHIMISHFHYCFMRSSWEDVRNWHINDSLSHNEASHLHHVLHIIGLRVHIVTSDFILLFGMICLLTNLT